jgi:NAD(P)H-dependent FMN reductase
MSDGAPRRRSVLLISGSTRAGSVNSAVIATAAALLPDGVDADVYDGLLLLPHFVPDHDPDELPPSVADLRRRIAACDAVFLTTPEYAGSMPAVLKNLLEWTVGGDEMSDKPCGWANASAPPGRAEATYEGLSATLRYTDGNVVDAACVAVPVARDRIGPDGLVDDPEARAAIAEALRQLLLASG